MFSIGTQWSPAAPLTSSYLSYDSIVVALDHNYCLQHSDNSTKSMDRFFNEMKEHGEEILQKKRKKISNLQACLRRKNLKLFTTKNLLLQLQNKNLVDAEIKWKLSARFDGLKLSLITNELDNKNKTNNRFYSDEILQFAQTLHFFVTKSVQVCA